MPTDRQPSTEEQGERERETTQEKQMKRITGETQLKGEKTWSFGQDHDTYSMWKKLHNLCTFFSNGWFTHVKQERTVDKHIIRSKHVELLMNSAHEIEC